VFFASGLAALLRRRKERRIEKLKTDFLDNVSHELKTPLAGIRISAELLAEGRIPDESRKRKTLDAIISETDRLSRMVAMLLDFGRLEKGNLHFNFEVFGMTAFIASLGDDPTLQAIAGPRLAFAPTHDGAPTVNVRADRDAVRRILVNLVENAVKYSPGEIEIETSGAEIRVLDRGEGVPAGDEERVFERFYRADNSLTRRTGGSGLGLSIARALARGMGGDLIYARRNGGGSVFTLSLKEVK
jgi:signal transduction histidine kinase